MAASDETNLSHSGKVTFYFMLCPLALMGKWLGVHSSGF